MTTVSLTAAVIDGLVPSAGNAAFMLMAVVMPISRRVERASGPGGPRLDPH